MKKRIFCYSKWVFVLSVLFLLMLQKPFSAKPLPIARFTGETFADASDDKEVVVLDISKLEKVMGSLTKDKNNITGFPDDILALNGKKVKVTGYLLIPYEAYYVETPLVQFAVAKSPYGCPCCSWNPDSPRPTILNTIFVTMKKGEAFKPPFSPLVEVTGTFEAETEFDTDDNGHKRLDGLFFILDAEAKKKRKLF